MSSTSWQSLGQIFAAPALIALASAMALLGALVADGVWDVVSSLCLAIPAIVFYVGVAWKKWRKPASSCPRHSGAARQG